VHQHPHLRLDLCLFQRLTRYRRGRDPNTRNLTFIIRLGAEDSNYLHVYCRRLVSFHLHMWSTTVLTVYSTTVVSIVRLRSIVNFASTNPTYDNVPATYWSVLEVFLGIICICLPALRQCYTQVSGRRSGSTESTSGYERHVPPSKAEPDSMLGNSRDRSSTSTTAPGITKTIATRLEFSKMEDDEIELVTFGSKIVL
jgi:hypothetical protein